MKTWHLTICISALILTGWNVSVGDTVNLSLEAFREGTPIPPTGQSSIRGIALSPDETTLYAAYWTDVISPVGIYPVPDYAPVDLESMLYGTCHGDVAVSCDGRYVFTTSYYQGDVSRFDTQDSYRRDSLWVGPWPSRIWMTPDGTKIIAGTNAWSGSPSCECSLAILDIAGGSFTYLATVPLYHNLAMLGTAAFSDERVYVPGGRSTREGPTLFEVSLSPPYRITRSLTFSEGDYLGGAATSEGKIYVGAYDAKKIYVVDQTTLTKTGEIGLDYCPAGVILHPDGQHLFVLFPENRAVAAIGLSTNLIEGYIDNLHDGQEIDIEFTSDGKTAYIANMGGPGSGGITVLGISKGALAVHVDIKPGGCPNPLDLKDRGVLSVAILGTPDFDVASVDAASICLAGVRPIRSAFEDVATPVPADAAECACTSAGPDGYLDLTLKFDVQVVVAALGAVKDGDVVSLTLTGTLLEESGGLAIEGKDCVTILSKGGKN